VPETVNWLRKVLPERIGGIRMKPLAPSRGRDIVLKDNVL
jgi:hypothetical protein